MKYILGIIIGAIAMYFFTLSNIEDNLILSNGKEFKIGQELYRCQTVLELELLSTEK